MELLQGYKISDSPSIDGRPQQFPVYLGVQSSDSCSYPQVYQYPNAENGRMVRISSQKSSFANRWCEKAWFLNFFLRADPPPPPGGEQARRGGCYTIMSPLGIKKIKIFLTFPSPSFSRPQESQQSTFLNPRKILKSQNHYYILIFATNNKIISKMTPFQNSF